MLDSRKRANEKWLAANYEQISFRAPKGTSSPVPFSMDRLRI